MKKIFLIAMFLCLVVLGARGVHAQPYDPYYDYNPYWNGAQYQGEPQEYAAYTSCCFQGGIVVPGWYGSVAPLRPIIVNPRPRRLR